MNGFRLVPSTRGVRVQEPVVRRPAVVDCKWRGSLRLCDKRVALGELVKQSGTPADGGESLFPRLQLELQ